MKVISKFILNSKTYVVLKGYGATHTMPESEYEKIRKKLENKNKKEVL